MNFSASRSRLCPRGFTLLELLSAVVVIAILAGLLVPVGTSLMKKSHAAKCSSNLRQIGLALHSYAGENNNCFPLVGQNSKDWDQEAIAPYLPLRGDGRQSTVFICPSARFKPWANSDLSRTYSASDCLMGIDPGTGNVAFTFSQFARNRNAIANPASAILLYDAAQFGGNRYSYVVRRWSEVSAAPDLQPAGGATTCLDYRHDKAMNALYVDGHVAMVPRKEAASITRTAWQGL